MEKSASVNDFFQEEQSSKKQLPQQESVKPEQIKKISRGRGRPREYPLQENVPSQQALESLQSLNQSNNSNNIQSFNSLQSETSKYQRLQQFWKTQIENYYRSTISQEQKNGLKRVIQQERIPLQQLISNKQVVLWEQKISLEDVQKYCTLISEINNPNYSFALLEHQGQKQTFVLVFDQNKHIQKVVEVSQEQIQLIAKRKVFMDQLAHKQEIFSKKNGRLQKLSQISAQIAFLGRQLQENKQKLQFRLSNVYKRVEQDPIPTGPSKVQQSYITFLIKKNIKKALQNNQIEYYNHFKSLDLAQHVSGLIDSKPITEKRDFQQYIRKRKTKKSGRKMRWILKTACGGCFSYHYQQYNPFSFCSQCLTRYHKYCYQPKSQGICQSCFLTKSNQTKRSRINQCQLCGMKGFLYLPMDESNNVHIFCMLINGLWRLQSLLLVFDKKYIPSAIEGTSCQICKQSNSLIYKCNQCQNHAHPLCAYINGWNIQLQKNQKKDLPDIVKLNCCCQNRQANQKRRRFILNYKKCVFLQCQG